MKLLELNHSFLLYCVLVLVVLLISSSAADVEEEEDVPPKEVKPHPDLPNFQEGITVRVVHRLDSCASVATSGKWLELQFVAKQLSDDGEAYEEYDSTHSRGRPLLIAVDDKDKLPGLSEGLRDVCVGEKREITIEANSPLMEVDPNSGLKQPQTDRPAVYDVMVTSILEHKPVNLFAKMDVDSDNQLSRDEVQEYLKKEQDVDTLFHYQDTDQNGNITYEEFKGPKYNHDEF